MLNELVRERPEDAIPDLPENQKARDFLKNAPTKGLHMPLGKEVKVMQCWRCKAYGHRTGDKECPLYSTGNLSNDATRRAREDPMFDKSVNVQSKSFEQPSDNYQMKKRAFALIRNLIDEIRREASLKNNAGSTESMHSHKYENFSGDRRRKRSSSNDKSKYLGEGPCLENQATNGYSNTDTNEVIEGPSLPPPSSHKKRKKHHRQKEHKKSKSH